MSKSYLPKFQRRLVVWCTPRRFREDLLKEIEEIYVEIAREKGIASAHQYLRWEVISIVKNEAGHHLRTVLIIEAVSRLMKQLL